MKMSFSSRNSEVVRRHSFVIACPSSDIHARNGHLKRTEQKMYVQSLLRSDGLSFSSTSASTSRFLSVHSHTKFKYRRILFRISFGRTRQVMYFVRVMRRCFLSCPSS